MTGRPLHPDELAKAAAMTEAQLQRVVIAQARREGWRLYHTADSRGSSRGFPDLVLIHPTQKRILWRELKTETGKLRPEQADWIYDLKLAGADAEIWRPIDWFSGTIPTQLGDPTVRLPWD